MGGAEIERPVRGRWVRWVWGLLIAGIMIVCVAAATGASYQFVSNRKDLRRFPQEGRSVDVGASV